ncbi:hypothetical protein KSC_031160 [Ktedonobacter sp. SOSP1-52]|nr:hypothetical protein KSC_031160 [Ktedonobacter sp. SOSP1-52]
MRSDGILAQGSLVNRRKGLITFELIYIYEVQGKTYSQIQRVDEEAFKGMNPNKAVTVCYIVENPEISVLSDIPVVYLEWQLFLLLLSLFRFM